MISSDVVENVVLRLKKEELLLDENSEILVIPSSVVISVSALLVGDNDDGLLLESKEVVVGDIISAERVEVEQIINAVSLGWSPCDSTCT